MQPFPGVTFTDNGGFQSALKFASYPSSRVFSRDIKTGRSVGSARMTAPTVLQLFAKMHTCHYHTDLLIVRKDDPKRIFCITRDDLRKYGLVR